MRKILCFTFMSLMFMPASGVRAQEDAPGRAAPSRSPEGPRRALPARISGEDLDEFRRAIAPMTRLLMETVTEAWLDMLEKPETAQRIAAYTRNYYEALIQEGFAREEALQIVSSSNIPSPPELSR